jgi:hypothetical protein
MRDISLLALLPHVLLWPRYSVDKEQSPSEADARATKRHLWTNPHPVPRGCSTNKRGRVLLDLKKKGLLWGHKS